MATPLRIPSFADLTKPTADGLVESCFIEPFDSEKVSARRGGSHRHPHYEIFWLQAGGGDHFSDFRSHRVEAGSLVFVAMGQVHAWRLQPRSHGVLVAFAPEALCAAGREGGALFDLPFFSYLAVQPTVTVPAAQRARFDELCAVMMAEYDGRGTLRIEALQAWLKLFVIECVRVYPSEGPPCSKNGALVTQRFLRLLDRSFLNVRRVRDYAAQLQLTPHRLIENVRERTGRTPGDLIEDRVFLEARRMLFNTTGTMAEIAYALEFKDPSHFGRFFKRRAGCSPGEARARFQRNGAAFV